MARVGRTKPIGLYLDPAEHQAFRVLAAQRGMSMGAYALELVRQALGAAADDTRRAELDAAQAAKPARASTRATR